MKEIKMVDKKWQAEDDARTLIRAQEILADTDRKKQAAAELKKQADAAQNAEQQLSVKTTKRLDKTFKGKNNG